MVKSRDKSIVRLGRRGERERVHANYLERVIFFALVIFLHMMVISKKYYMNKLFFVSWSTSFYLRSLKKNTPHFAIIAVCCYYDFFFFF